MADNSEQLVAPCGMNCSVCAMHLAMKHDIKSKGIKIPYCAGCRPRNKNCAYLKKWCPKLSNNEVIFCFECSNFPCNHLKTIDNRYRTRYHISLIQNLLYIKENSLEEFITQQEKTWKCLNCGEKICCHNGICFNCELEKLKQQKEKYR